MHYVNKVLPYHIGNSSCPFNVTENYDRPLFKAKALTEDMSKREQFMNTVVREMLNGTIPDHVTYGGESSNKLSTHL